MENYDTDMNRWTRKTKADFMEKQRILPARRGPQEKASPRSTYWELHKECIPMNQFFYIASMHQGSALFFLCCTHVSWAGSKLYQVSHLGNVKVERYCWLISQGMLRLLDLWLSIRIMSLCAVFWCDTGTKCPTGSSTGMQSTVLPTNLFIFLKRCILANQIIQTPGSFSTGISPS